MPGVYVFPGGMIDPPDRIAWSVEAGTEVLGSSLARSARAALRETWEEAGVLIGRPGGSWPPAPAARAASEELEDIGGTRSGIGRSHRFAT
jgi:8-oxo-dGTP pyrophosphatase MutT (NUDIX family)